MEKVNFLVKYLYKPTKLIPVIKYKIDGPYAVIEKKKGELIGCLVSTANGSVGWSLIHHLDRKNKSLKEKKSKAYDIALARALKAESLGVDKNDWYANNVPQSIETFFINMLDRSNKYFK